MTRARLLQTAAATFATLALAACGGAEVETDTYAEAEPTPAYAVTTSSNEAVMGAVERNDFNADYDSAADYDLADNTMDDDREIDLDDMDDLDDDDDLDDVDADIEIDEDDDDAVQLYRDVDDYEPYRK